jgi:hypothetical protein
MAVAPSGCFKPSGPRRRLRLVCPQERGVHAIVAVPWFPSIATRFVGDLSELAMMRRPLLTVSPAYKIRFDLL